MAGARAQCGMIWATPHTLDTRLNEWRTEDKSSGGPRSRISAAYYSGGAMWCTADPRRAHRGRRKNDVDRWAREQDEKPYLVSDRGAAGPIRATRRKRYATPTRARTGSAEEFSGFEILLRDEHARRVPGTLEEYGAGVAVQTELTIRRVFGGSPRNRSHRRRGAVRDGVEPRHLSVHSVHNTVKTRAFRFARDSPPHPVTGVSEGSDRAESILSPCAVTRDSIGGRAGALYCATPTPIQFHDCGTACGPRSAAARRSCPYGQPHPRTSRRRRSADGNTAPTRVRRCASDCGARLTVQTALPGGRTRSRDSTRGCARQIAMSLDRAPCHSHAPAAAPAAPRRGCHISIGVVPCKSAVFAGALGDRGQGHMVISALVQGRGHGHRVDMRDADGVRIDREPGGSTRTSSLRVSPPSATPFCAWRTSAAVLSAMPRTGLRTVGPRSACRPRNQSRSGDLRHLRTGKNVRHRRLRGGSTNRCVSATPWSSPVRSSPRHRSPCSPTKEAPFIGMRAVASLRL